MREGTVLSAQLQAKLGELKDGARVRSGKDRKQQGLWDMSAF